MAKKTKIKVGGMMCDGCVKTVTNVLSSIEGVEKVKVELKSGEALIKSKGNLSSDLIKERIEEAGFSFEGEI